MYNAYKAVRELQRAVSQVLSRITALEAHAGASGSAPSPPPSAMYYVPTTMQQDFTVPAHEQRLYSRRIVIGEGQRIALGEDAALVGV